MLNQLWNLAGVDINHISGVVHYVVSENSANVVGNLGEQVPYALLGLVLPLLALDVVLEKFSELEPVCEREVCLVQFLK